MPEKLLTYLFFPPGGFLILIGISLWLWNKRPGFARILVLLTGLSLYLLSISPISNLLLLPLERPYRETFSGKADVIVVLGGGAEEGCAGEIRLTGTSTKRVLKAYMLWKKTHLPLVVSGGKLREGDWPEARYMEEVLKKLGVMDVLRGERAINTRQEAEEVKKIMGAYGWKTAYLVTSAFHMKRAVFAFRAHGVKVIPVATDFRSSSSSFFFLPSTKSLDDSFIALHEYAGLLYYWMRKVLLSGNGP